MQRNRTRVARQPSNFDLARTVSLALLACFVLPCGITAAQQQQRDRVELARSIEWTIGPAEADVGGVAGLHVPAGHRFTHAAGARLWMELCGNPPGDELGVLIPPLDETAGTLPNWFVIFSYTEIGHVPEDEQDQLNDATATAILDAIREGTAQANHERQRRGWDTLTVLGWQQQPFFDPATKNLTWSIRSSGRDGVTVNYDSRVLGRRGVMNVKMVLGEEELGAAVPAYRTVLAGLSFRSGETHAEFRPGDKTAEYGLIGLVTGGAAVVAVKSWKPLVMLGAVIVAALGALGRKISAFFGWRGTPQLARASASTSPAGAAEAGSRHADASVLVPCPNCKRMNRVANDRLHDGPKCGGCGAVLTGAGGGRGA